MAANLEHQKLCEAFQARARIQFKNADLLATAFTHRSYLNEARVLQGQEHNERLEFLGDAVLELVVTDYLYSKFPKATEGDLTSYRAALVNAVTLSKVAEELGMNECLLLSKGEAKDTGRARATILANTFEAVVGALYLDQGMTPTKEFVERTVLPIIDEVLEKGSWRDSKSAFQEFAQAKYGKTPLYQTISSEGPDHDKHFIVSVSVGEDELGRGEGKSKQEAEQMAAERALKDGKGES